VRTRSKRRKTSTAARRQTPERGEGRVLTKEGGKRDGELIICSAFFALPSYQETNESVVQIVIRWTSQIKGGMDVGGTWALSSPQLEPPDPTVVASLGSASAFWTLAERGQAAQTAHQRQSPRDLCFAEVAHQGSAEEFQCRAAVSGWQPEDARLPRPPPASNLTFFVT
jgi:hypothetical protein